MRICKLKQEFHETETQSSDDSDYCAADSIDSSSKQKRKNKRKRMDTVSPKLKSPNSKDKQASDSPKKSRSSRGRRRTSYTDLYDDVEAKYSVMERADRVLSRLGNKLPHFLKCMLPSNVAHGFWLHMPKNFCSVNLPDHNTSIVLVDEWGNEYKTSYLLHRHGLSAGWKGFSTSHRLLKGDILIFHLMAPCKFKVHIVRVNSADVLGSAICLMDMYASERERNGDHQKVNRKRRQTKYVEPYHFDTSSPVVND